MKPNLLITQIHKLRISSTELKHVIYQYLYFVHNKSTTFYIYILYIPTLEYHQLI